MFFQLTRQQKFTEDKPFTDREKQEWNELKQSMRRVDDGAAPPSPKRK